MMSSFGAMWTLALRGVLAFVVSGLDINGCMLNYFEGTANLQYIVLSPTHYVVHMFL